MKEYLIYHHFHAETRKSYIGITRDYPRRHQQHLGYRTDPDFSVVFLATGLTKKQALRQEAEIIALCPPESLYNNEHLHGERECVDCGGTFDRRWAGSSKRVCRECYNERQREWKREKYANDPEWREREKARIREYYHRRKEEAAKNANL